MSRTLNNISLCDSDFGRLSSVRMHTVKMDLGQLEILKLQDLHYFKGDKSVSLQKEMNFPYTIIPESDNGFTEDLENWLLKNGFIVDDVVFKYDYKGNAFIEIVNTNFNFDKARGFNPNSAKTFVFSTNNNNLYLEEVINGCGPSSPPFANEDLFKEKIIYPQTGSNISKIEWVAECGLIHKYDFEYDDLDRLTNADYSYENNISTYNNDNYNTTVDYDLMGNITHLERRGYNPSQNQYTQIDDLTYTYSANKLSSLAEANTYNLGYKSYTYNGSYEYDNNGNQTSDGNKYLSFDWNYDNKLTYIENLNSNPREKITMQYFGDGTMYKKVKWTSNINTPLEVKLYEGPAHYVSFNGGQLQLEAVYHDDGRLIPDGYDANGDIKWKFEYHIKDHLGNNRVLFTDRNNDGTILNGSDGSGDNIQIYHYYPFGMTMDVLGNSYASNSTENPYQYNGKEIFKDFGFNSYNYGARWYDPSVGRFSGVDPLADEYNSWSPYTYTLNNPIRYIDPTGMSAEDVIDIDKKTGNISVTKAAGDDVVRLVNNGKVESSYTYGTNGSFSNDNQIINGDFDGSQGTALVNPNGDKAQTFFEFAAQSDVEFGKLDVLAPNGNSVSVVNTSHDTRVTATLPSIVKELSSRGFTGVKQSHSHPGTITDYNESVPSGYYDNIAGNPSSLMPYLKNGRNEGDALNAIQVKSLKGFGNTKFEVYAPGNNTTTTYDGVNRAKIRKN